MAVHVLRERRLVGSLDGVAESYTLKKRKVVTKMKSVRKNATKKKAEKKKTKKKVVKKRPAKKTTS